VSSPLRDYLGSKGIPDQRADVAVPASIHQVSVCTLYSRIIFVYDLIRFPGYSAPVYAAVHEWISSTYHTHNDARCIARARTHTHTHTHTHTTVPPCSRLSHTHTHTNLSVAFLAPPSLLPGLAASGRAERGCLLVPSLV